jgi:hypothetical protein
MTPSLLMMTVTDPVVPDGRGGGGGMGGGGAIFVHEGRVEIINSTLHANRAEGGNAGGTPASPSGVMGDVAGYATAGAGYGGAIFNLDGEVILTNSTIARNRVASGASLSPNLGPKSDGQQLFTMSFGYAAPVAKLTLRNTIVGESVPAQGAGTPSDVVIRDEHLTESTPSSFPPFVDIDDSNLIAQPLDISATADGPIRNPRVPVGLTFEVFGNPPGLLRPLLSNSAQLMGVSTTCEQAPVNKMDQSHNTRCQCTMGAVEIVLAPSGGDGTMPTDPPGTANSNGMATGCSQSHASPSGWWFASALGSLAGLLALRRRARTRRGLR